MTENEQMPKEQMVDDEVQPSLRNHLPNKNKNIRHLVTFGIIIVLFTLYITATAIRQSNSNNDMDHNDQDLSSLRNSQAKETIRQAKILEKLQEHEHICSELEIFIKEFKWNDDDKLRDSEENSLKASDPNNKTISENKKKSSEKLEENKEDQSKKKNSTAEPIIYLFALVFIYLLLKAASDINQHYKSQAKGDKRLRRCSLQSYAQTHKQDRRASKDKTLTAIIRQKQQFLEQRSLSFERPTKLSMAGQRYIERKFDILSMSDHNLHQSRRCSVPVNAKNYNFPSDMSRRTSIVYGGGGNTSGSSLAGSLENVDLQFAENKRRVRMINRH